MKENSVAEKILLAGAGVILEWEKDLVTLDECLERLRKDDFPWCSAVTSLLFEYFRHKSFVDDLIRKRAVKGVKQDVRALLACALTSCLFQTGIAAESCANVTVECAKRHFGKGCGNFVNAILRSVLRDEALRDGPIPFSFPESLRKHFLAQFGEEKTASILSSCGHNEMPVFRLRGEEIAPAPDVYEELPAQEHTVPFRFFRILDPKTFFGSDPLLKEGLVYVQDPATMLALSLLEDPPAGDVLDICAAPGGKSILLWDLAKRGKSSINLTVCDRSSARLALLKENLARFAVEASAYAMSAQKHSFRENSFDLILADVPCGNSGVMRRRCDVPWRYSPRRLRETVELQQEILDSLASLVKYGGQLLYSTCSIEKEEDEEQVRRFLVRHTEFSLVREKKLFPDKDHDGAYGALLKKEK